MCEECETFHDRTWRHVVERQSNPLFVPSVMKTHIPLSDDPTQPEEDLLQRYREQIEKLSQQDRVRKFCTDAGFLTTIEVGQYFMTKDIAEISQFTDAVACPEYTLPRDEDSSEPNGWIKRNTKIGSIPEVATCCLQSKYGVEIRIMSINKDNSHSWVRISHGLQVGHEFEQQWAGNLRSAVRRLCVEIDCTCFCKPIKGQSKTTKTYFCQLVHKNNTDWGKNLDRCWTTRIFNLRLCSVEKTDLSSSSWKTTSRRWWSDWILENQSRSSEIFLALSSLVWRQVEKHGRRRNQEKIPVLHWFIRSNSFPPSSSRSFRTQSYWSFITGQCGDSEQLLPAHLSCRMCNQVTFIINSGLIPGGQNLSKRQTIFFLPVNPMDKNHKDPDTIDLNALRHAQDMFKAWKKHQNTVYWVDINLALKKGLKFYQTRSKAIILYHTFPAYCIGKPSDTKWRNHVRKSIWIISTASEDFFEKWLDERIGFRSCSTSRRQLTNPTKP